ncbi:uncharacterized protein LOC131211227 [Anopheles bellator]|uniref:uncharacterized protein LOC131211227 n=1 Tax=Anopheles bellator TaxID=139047 RepID=UPI00264933FA|nr:uncharacterized protein LOC131211227 [Anopheles bellator]
MSMNPCKNGDREKDQNNNFVNSTAHGGAGVDREGRARRAAARSAVGEEGSHPQQQPTRNSDTRRDQHNGYYRPGQQRDHQRSPAGRATGGAGGGGATGGGAGPQVTAKVMWGNVSAIKELRDKEQTDRQYGTRAAGRRQ